MNTDRVPCAVPGCRRTTALERLTKGQPADPDRTWEWLCPTHWQMIPPRMKRAYARLRRRERRFGVHLDTASRVWRRIKSEVGA